jgi:anthranilate phosphoribosyltransferase
MTTAKISALLEKLMRRENLSVDESAEVMSQIMSGEATPAQIGALLVGLTMKGERPEEIVGLAKTMRANAVKLSKSFDDVFDTCGTGGDRSGTFNISSAAALVAAAAGLRVAKHGNRSVSSQCGSADVYEALGVEVAAPPEVVEHSLETVGIAFFFAPTFHPSMRHAAPVRRELGVRTAFNLLGPLTNPAGTRYQLVGVPQSDLTELIARALLLLGADRAWVVHGADGIDEMSTTGHTKVSECRNGAVSTFYVHPADFGLPKADRRDLEGGNAAANAAIVREVLAGAKGPRRDVVLLNAGASLFIAGKAASVRDGIARAARAIDSGAADKTLNAMASASKRQPAASSAAVRGLATNSGETSPPALSESAGRVEGKVREGGKTS